MISRHWADLAGYMPYHQLTRKMFFTFVYEVETFPINLTCKNHDHAKYAQKMPKLASNAEIITNNDRLKSKQMTDPKGSIHNSII